MSTCSTMDNSQAKSLLDIGISREFNLLNLVGTEMVQVTDLARKVTYGGKTETYPVYRVRLDALYYNDQNDRISTWITRYESENGLDSLKKLDRESYNQVIEKFICESNPEAIQRTKKNIEVVGQREPGVTLADGRIVDGNRRYTCLRKIQTNKKEPIYFETVIMNLDIQEDKKQIKLLELSIQHGEEKKVDYDLIDYAIGTYRDVVLTKLITIDEYAMSTNETLAEVKRRIEIAELISEFLVYIKLPEQYHIAREYQVYSLFQEMMAPLHQLPNERKSELKKIVFNNAIMKAMPDQRKFIRDIKNLIRNDGYSLFFDKQKRIDKIIQTEMDGLCIQEKADLDKFAENNTYITEMLQSSMEKALQKSRIQRLKNKPTEIVSKSIVSLTEIDTKLLDKMSIDEKDKLREQIDELCIAIEKLRKYI